jgi:hypothetical protein
MKTQKETNISTASEYIHYPQYAILTILMVLWLDPKKNPKPFWRILFWATLMGIFDERRGCLLCLFSHTRPYSFW